MATVVNNKNEKRFELATSAGKMAVLEYQLANGGTALALTHTYVPSEARAQGLGSELVEGALCDIRKNNQRVVPICPFVINYMRNHSEWDDIML
jgi:predicted GNAT family acetyltransferase